jgi:hypothetical protein
MRATERRVNRSWGFAVSGIAAVSVWALGGQMVRAADADLFVVSGSLSTTADIPLFATPVNYSIDNTSSCLAMAAPPPVSTPVPNYVDVPPDESGNCTSVSGNGTLTVSACSTGTITATWSVTEPAADTATFDGGGVVVGGVAVMATQPAGSFTDDGVTTGQGVVVGVLTPRLGGSPVCGQYNHITVNAAVAGTY